MEPDLTVWSVVCLEIAIDGGEPWMLAGVIDGSGALRAVQRARPHRGQRIVMGELVDRAIAAPLLGRPSLPGRLRVASDALADELVRAPVAIAVEVAPTPEADRTLERLASRYLTRNASWRWLGDGIGRAAVRAMFRQIDLLVTSFAWYVLSGREAVRARFDDGDELHLRLEARRRLDGELAIALHVAPDAQALAAWREGLRGDRQITIEAIDSVELSRQAVDEIVFISGEPHERYPRVVTGIQRASPGRNEWWTAMRALEAFNALFDNSGSALGRQRRVLANLTGVELEILDPELMCFDVNHHSARIAEVTAATRDRRSGQRDRLRGGAATAG